MRMVASDSKQDAADSESNVRVAVHVRPLIASEQEDGCQEGSIFVASDVPQARLLTPQS